MVVVIASVLKPVDDVRMYKKFTKSLVRTGNYTLNIVGFRSRKATADSSVRFYPIFDFPRLSWRRAFANYTFYRTLREISPQLVILTTPELYPALWWYRKRFGVRLVYDVVENYGRNIRYNRGFPRVTVSFFSRGLSIVENSLLTTSQLLLLAEKGYSHELSLPPSAPVCIIENKALKPANLPIRMPSSRRPLSFIYTGTVSEVYGIELALNVMKALIEVEGLPATLTVLGHVPQASLYRRLVTYAEQHPWLTLHISRRPVPHSDILSLIEQADVGIISHQPVPSIAHCFPTRIWEYMAYRLPFLLQAHPYWTEYCTPWECAIPLDFNRPVTHEIAQSVTKGTFYPRGVPDTIYWKSEEKKLVMYLDRIREQDCLPVVSKE